jgi:hypothetical protein
MMIKFTAADISYDNGVRESLRNGKISFYRNIFPGCSQNQRCGQGIVCVKCSGVNNN